MKKKLKNKINRIANQELHFNKRHWIIQRYKNAYLEILKLLATKNIIGGTAAFKRGILREINQILEKLDKDSSRWVRQEIPKYYTGGRKASEKMLAVLGFRNLKRAGAIHTKAIEVMANETYMMFGEALQIARKDAIQAINIATREEIVDQLARGVISGEPSKEMAKKVKGIMQDRGISSLVDKGGKRWQLDVYAEMLVRTKTAEAYRIGNHNRQLENDFDLVQISSHGAPDDCINVEGKVFSLTGRTPGYPTEGDIMGMSSHIFRPNCRHTTTPYVPEFEENPDKIQGLSNKSKPISTDELKDQGFRMDTKTRNQTLKELAKK